MSKLLTISIAAYNVESYIGQTLDSLCANEILDDIEVFIIDDGGTDNTLLIAGEYEKRFPDTFHAIHKKNGGYGSTVNWSMEHATGKYFKLLDGDDWMDKQGLIRLVEFLRNCDADLVLSGRAEINDSGERSHTSNYWETLYGECFDNQTVRLEQLETPFVYGIWVATYRTEIIKNYPNVLPEHQLYTDRMFICYWLPWIRTVAFQHYDVYCYRFGHEGQSVSLENRKRHSAEAIEGFKILLQFYGELDNIEKANEVFLNLRMTRYFDNVLKTILLLPASKGNLNQIITLDREMRETSKQLYNYCGKHSRILFLLRKSNYFAYWLLKMRRVSNWK